MANLERLRANGLRAYELGRLRYAARIGFYLLPLVAACALTTGQGEFCACLGVLIFMVAAGCRWRNRQGAQDSALGMAAGVIPLMVGLGASCLISSLTTTLSLNIGLLAVAGMMAGAWIGMAQTRRQAKIARFSVALIMALLTGSLGAASFGMTGILGLGCGMILGCLLARSCAAS